MATSFAGRSFLATLGLVFLAIAVLFTTDMFLAKMDRVESAVEAARLFEQGRALMARGNNDDAIGRITDAIAIERGNRGYRQTLAQAQFAAGKTADAESTLAELLRSDPGDGLASLVMARVLVKEGRFPEAISYFHRAIYGRWEKDAAENRLRVRFELIDLLEQHNFKGDLLAELLPVQDQIPRDEKTRMRMGRLFLLAGSPIRAADAFRAIIRDSPASAGAFAGLGEAEFARGNYRAARQDFQVALRLAPDDQPTRERLALCNEVIILDPTTRGLWPAERFRRSLRLVELTRNETSECTHQNPPPELQGLLDTAGKALKAHVSATHQSEAAESNLDLAEQLWQARRKACKSPLTADTPLALILARLSQ